jgi:RHS repeat-associated protein
VTNTAYPLYDTHGNMVATLTKNTGGTSWSIGDERSYDVWGGVRSGAATGGPKGRYVANLGHVQDDESGLIYMRARYYEPESGRFVSEDKAGDGKNWFVYASNSPTNNVDEDERDALHAMTVIAQILMFFGGAILLDMWALADAAVYKLSNWIQQAQSMAKAGLIYGTEDVLQFNKELDKNRAMLRRGKAIGGVQTMLKILGYLMLVKTFLMDLDFGDGISGLDIFFGNAEIKDVFWGK